MLRRIWLVVAAIAAGACGAPATVEPLAPLTTVGRAFCAADTLFKQERLWLGGDAAITIPLSAGRTLWLSVLTFA